MKDSVLVFAVWTIISGCYVSTSCASEDGNWYRNSFYLLHEDHHTTDKHEVGKDADPSVTSRLIGLSKPDVTQIHAKGNPGWTTYPTEIGYTPPRLKDDVMAVWRDIARNGGYRFSAYYNIGRDGEIMKRHPEWNRIKANGKPYDRMLCYHSGVAEAYLWPMIEEIMDRYEPDGFWFDGSCFTVNVCYCGKCRSRFHREQGLDAPERPEDEGWAEYKEMQRQIYREFIRRTTDRIKQRDPDCLVAVNWAYSLMMPEEPYRRIDYLTGDRGNSVDVLSQEAHWYDSASKPFDLMTTIFLRNASGLAPKPAEQIQQEMAIIIANGGRYFAWDNPTSTSGLSQERHEFLADAVAPFLRARQKWCLQSERVPDVSLLYSAASHYAVGNESTRVFPPGNYMRPVTEVLCRAHLNYEMISDHRLRALDIRSPLLIVANPELIDSQNAEALRRYVAGEGTVLITGKGLKFEGLAELVGLELLSDPVGSEDWTVKIDDRSFGFRNQLHRTRPAGAGVLLSAKDKQGRQYPLFTEYRVGKSRALCALLPLFAQPEKQGEVPGAVLSYVLQKSMPPEERLVVTDAPETVEVVLRQRNKYYFLHLVNRAPGKRDSARSQWSQPYQRITDIPTAPRCHVSIKSPSKPVAVRLEPQGVNLDSWAYKNGRIEADVPEFQIHQILVMRTATEGAK